MIYDAHVVNSSAHIEEATDNKENNKSFPYVAYVNKNNKTERYELLQTEKGSWYWIGSDGWPPANVCWFYDTEQEAIEMMRMKNPVSYILQGRDIFDFMR